ncbi:helix-turn-helix domain-containing protein [Pediococcus argentinicus]|nr:helix-turn-helix transcriptional regulator [Pediococcus argentinicus]NKZ22788.1 helix-turn-helix transcriptional regulator [Pediococcus argentinicus]GEP19833.1 hypothetical protein LSA03_12170 [Pediococcus argentinicus]
MGNNSNIGSRIKLIRTTLGMTQEELAELSGLSVNYLSRIERTNNQNITIQKLVSIADSLGVSIMDLIGNDSDVNNRPEYLKVLIKQLNKLDNEDAEQLSHSFLKIVELFEKNKDNNQQWFKF